MEQFKDFHENVITKEQLKELKKSVYIEEIVDLGVYVFNKDYIKHTVITHMTFENAEGKITDTFDVFVER